MDTTRATTPSALPPRAFRTPVRGHAFAPRPPGTTGPVPGQLARLIREPGNPADPFAVGVWVVDGGGRWRIGYLDRGVAVRLAPRLDDGAEVAVQVAGWTTEPEGRWQRPVVVVLPNEADAPTRGPATEGHRDQRDGRRTQGLWGRPPGVVRRVVRPADQASVSASSDPSSSGSGSGSGSGAGRDRVPTSTMRSCGT